MASAYDQNIGTELITTGEQAGLWGITTNNNFTNVFGQALYGSGTLTMAADADEAFQVPQNVAVLNAIRAASLTIASAVPLTLQRTVTLRSPIAAGISKFYSLKNGTTGGQTIVVRTTPGGTGLLIPNGKRVLLKLDGVNAEEQFDYSPSLSGSLLGFRNRIVNGDIRFDQRREGGLSGAIGVSPFSAFGPDHFIAAGSGTAQFMVQKVGGDGPPGFSHYMRFSVTTADAALTGTENAYIMQRVEGSYIWDFNWGRGASALPAAFQFFTRSNVAGNFGAVIRNPIGTRAYPFLYTNAAANVWQLQTVIVPPEPGGVWADGATTGAEIIWSMGAAAGLQVAPGAWLVGGHTAVLGQTSILDTVGRTFDLTGVQLEPGNVVTPFERLSPTQALLAVQRYYWKTFNEGTVPQQDISAGSVGGISSGTRLAFTVPFPVAMRTIPAGTIYRINAGGASGQFWNIVSGGNTSDANFAVISTKSAFAQAGVGVTDGVPYLGNFTFDAEM